MKIMTSCSVSIQLAEHPLRPTLDSVAAELEVYVETLPKQVLPTNPKVCAIAVLRAGNWLQVGPIVGSGIGCFACVRGRFLQHVPGGRFWGAASPIGEPASRLSPVWAYWVMTTLQILVEEETDLVYQVNMITGEWRSGRFIRVSSCSCGGD